MLTGAGRGFCAGQDLAEFREAPGDIGDRLRATYHPNVLAIRALEKPVIAAVNGAGRRRGPLASPARATFASRPTRPASCRPSSASASSPTRAARSSHAAPRLRARVRVDGVGPQADRGGGARLGLVSEVVEADALAGRAAEVAAELAALPTRADRDDEAPVRPRRRRHARGAARAGGSAADGRDRRPTTSREGVAAFLEKRPPEFKGR